MLDPKLVGQRIREAREAHDWSQRTLAKKLRVSERSVQRWERGELPRPPDLRRLAEVLDVPSYFLLLPPKEIETIAEMGERLRRIESLLESGRARPATRARRAS